MEFAAHCHQLATDTWGDISMEAVDHAVVDTFLHDTLDSEAAWSAMQWSPQNIDDAFEYLQQAMHNWKSLLSSRNRTKAMQSVSFAKETEKKVIHISKPASNSPPSKLEERFSKLESSVEEQNKHMAQILHLLQNKSPSKPGTLPRGCFKYHEVGHFAKDCPTSQSRSPSPARGGAQDQSALNA